MDYIFRVGACKRAFSRLTAMVSSSPNLLIGSSVARNPRIRTKAAQEAWLITQVRIAKGGGNPSIYGIRFSTIGPNSKFSFLDSKGRQVHGSLKDDWVLVSSPPVGEAFVRTPVALCLSPEMEAKALALEPPYDKLPTDLLDIARQKRDLHMKRILGISEKVDDGPAAGSEKSTESTEETPSMTAQDKKPYIRSMEGCIKWADASGVQFPRTPFRAVVSGLPPAFPWQALHVIASKVGQVAYVHAGEINGVGWCGLVEMMDKRGLNALLKALVSTGKNYLPRHDFLASTTYALPYSHTPRMARTLM